MNPDATIDLRSDTVTRPSPEMRKAIASAPVGDDIYGEDPTVNDLEARAAQVTGKQAALFVPSGTQANLIAQMVLGTPGEEVILGAESHIMRFEAGGGAALAGSQFSVVPGDGLFTAGDVEERLRTRTLHTPGAALVWVENTHNMAGGRIFPMGELESISQLCASRGIPLHMDGARVFNAAAALRVPVDRIARWVGTLSFCLSKGLGAPVGSMLCGPVEFVGRARRMRKRLGGAMRQAGVLAAAGRYALEHNVQRLAIDHDNARIMARGLADLPGMRVDVGKVDTNIVMASCERMAASDLAARAASLGVLFHPLGGSVMRFVTHLDVDEEMVREAVSRIARVLG